MIVRPSVSRYLQRVKFFASAKYRIAGSDYSGQCVHKRKEVLNFSSSHRVAAPDFLPPPCAADDMENGVLRGNRPAASNLWTLVGLPQFSGGQFADKSDPRRAKVQGGLRRKIVVAAELTSGLLSFAPRQMYVPCL